MRDNLRKEYCLEFEKILKIMKTDYKNDYYAFFNPKYYDSYLILKLKYIISKLKTKIPYLKDKILKF